MFIVAIVLLFILRLRFPTHLPISTIIQQRYGIEVLRLFRLCERTDRKLRKTQLDLNFLHECQSFGVIPNFLHFKVANQHLHRSKAYEKCRNQLLKTEINSKKIRVKTLQTELNTHLNKLKDCTSTLDYNHFFNCMTSSNLSFLKKIEINQNHKLTRLKQKYLASCINPKDVIFNYSSYKLNEIEEKVLSRGLKFNILPKKLDFCEFLTPFEKLARKLKYQPTSADFNWDFIKTKLKDIALTSYHGYNSASLPLNISKAELAALHNLSKNKDIVILRPDKGNGVVILDKTDYIKKVEFLLMDSTKFKPLDADILELCIRRENKLIRFLRDNLCKTDAISQALFHQLHTSGSKPGILYGLPKIHKQDCPARPIMSAIGTYNYQVAKFLVPILQPFTANTFSVRDSFSFVSEMTNLQFEQPVYMASFDVNSLFTNIPLEESIELCTNLVFQDKTLLVKPNEYCLNREQFRKLLVFAVKDNHFIFNGLLYDQIDGVAMGSPLGPILANIFMNTIETKFLCNCPIEFKPVLYRRYVDDTFCLFKDHTHIEKFFTFINQQHTNIQFTFEIETNGSLPFLDVLISRDSNHGFFTNVYRKKTFTGLYTHFDSLSPIKYKINLVRILIYRAFHLCSSFLSFHFQINKIKEVLSLNSFPRPFVDRIIRTFLNNNFLPRPLVSTAPKLCLQIYLPFLGPYSLRLQSKLKKLIQQAYPHINLRTIFLCTRQIQSFFPFKDRVPTRAQTSLIYQFTCNECNSFYIGKTSRHFQTRCLEHLGLNKHGKSIKTSSSSIKDHILSSGHKASLHDFKILHRSNNDFDLLIHESLFIREYHPTLNLQNSSIPLCLFN